MTTELDDTAELNQLIDDYHAGRTGPTWQRRAVAMLKYQDKLLEISVKLIKSYGVDMDRYSKLVDALAKKQNEETNGEK